MEQEQRSGQDQSLIRRLGWLKESKLKESKNDALLQAHRERQLRQSLEIMNQLIHENAHRPESISLLRKILRERAELQILRTGDETSLSG